MHALCNLSGRISGRVTPAAQMKAQRPIRRHHRIAWGQIHDNSETHKCIPSFSDASGLVQMHKRSHAFTNYYFQTSHLLY